MIWVSEQELQDVLGVDDARRFLRAVGGVRTYIPARPDADHKIALIVGLPGMAALCREYGGEYLSLPTSGERDTIEKQARRLLRAGGKSQAAIARECQTSLRYVEKIARKLREEQEHARQGLLPGLT